MKEMKRVFWRGELDPRVQRGGLPLRDAGRPAAPRGHRGVGASWREAFEARPMVFEVIGGRQMRPRDRNDIYIKYNI